LGKKSEVKWQSWEANELKEKSLKGEKEGTSTSGKIARSTRGKQRMMEKK